MRVGVIDIGYNAIRAAAYENDTISAREIFNNKFKNDIFSLLAGQDLNVKHQTYLSIEYILRIFRNLNVKIIKCVATAVLRNHKRAGEFLAHVKEHYDIEIEVVSGEQEAYLTATGVMSGIPAADGIAADLGGGSLELVEVCNGAVGRTVSLELGTKIISGRKIGNLETLIEIIREGYGDQQYKNLYFVGGALRFICRLYIEMYKYPLKTLHNLAITQKECLKFLDDVYNTKIAKNKMKRKELNKNAILIAKAMIELFNPENIVISTYGLKEGVRYEMLSDEQKQQNIILAKLANTFNCVIEQSIVDSYLAIFKPLFKNVQYIDECAKLMQYSMIISSSKFCYDQTVPPLMLAENILTSEIQFTHKERAKLALIIFYITNFKVEPHILKISRCLLTKKENILCQIIGNFIRICLEIDGPEFKQPSFSVSQQGSYLEVKTDYMLPRPIFDKACEKLKSIAFCLRNMS